MFRYLYLFLIPVILHAKINSTIPEASLEITPSMKVIYHPVSTQNKEAQKQFDEGLTNIFAFNHDLAFISFQKAADLDPNLAMAYWGMTLALGQNINNDVTKENELLCYNFIQKALSLISGVSDNEKAYIIALSKRYTNDPNADLIPFRTYYRQAMQKVHSQFPEDLDASTLYAESILDIDPWKWWNLNGTPKKDTFEAMDLLEFVLRRNPYHVRANHYYIHALEESPYPERALPSAHRLRTLLMNSGHLLHMPCHIFILLGDYELALETSKNAVAADKYYIANNWVEGTYPVHYLSHNLYVEARVYMLMEEYENAITTALEMIDFLNPYFEEMKDMFRYAFVPLEIYLNFHKWQEILDYKLPLHTPVSDAYFHFSRAVAYASLNNLDAAQKERDLMQQFVKEIPNEHMAWNSIFSLADALVGAKFAKVLNQKQKYFTALEKAVAIQDTIFYDEPPFWYVPVRQLLGEAYLEDKRFEEAEDLFCEALSKLNRNGRLLFGLYKSLVGQEREIEAYWVKREMANALPHTVLQLSDLSW